MNCKQACIKYYSKCLLLSVLSTNKLETFLSRPININTGTEWMYLHGGAVVPQLRSSDMSPQSLSPSQIQRAGIQRPVLAHWNWPGRHAAQSQWYVTHVPCNGVFSSRQCRAMFPLHRLKCMSYCVTFEICQTLISLCSFHFISLIHFCYIL